MMLERQNLVWIIAERMVNTLVLGLWIGTVDTTYQKIHVTHLTFFIENETI